MAFAEFVCLVHEEIEVQERASVEVVGGVAGVDEVGVELAPDQVVGAGTVA